MHPTITRLIEPTYKEAINSFIAFRHPGTWMLGNTMQLLPLVLLARVLESLVYWLVVLVDQRGC